MKGKWVYVVNRVVNTKTNEKQPTDGG